jgi:hypothetical protein
MDDELERLLEAARHADQAFMEHRRTGYEAYSEGGDSVGTGDAGETLRAWSMKHDALLDEARRAHEAWLSYRPHH